MDTALALVPFQGFLHSHSNIGGFLPNLSHGSVPFREQPKPRVSVSNDLDLIYGSDGKVVVRPLSTGSLIDIYV